MENIENLSTDELKELCFQQSLQLVFMINQILQLDKKNQNNKNEKSKGKRNTMKKLTAVKATSQDNLIINAAVDAVRSVLERFHEANKSIGFAPRAMLQVSVIDSRFSLTLEGSARSPANGRDIDEAMENLCANPDAEFLRSRAFTLIEKAEELRREADELDGFSPEAADPVADEGTAGTDNDNATGATQEGGAE